MARKTKADALLTRQRLIDAAIEQFALRGVSDTTLSDIADAAGMTRGAVYWHFSSKAELFNEMWRQQLPISEIIKYQVIFDASLNPFTYLRELFITGLQYIAGSPRQRALMQILYHKCEFNKEMMSEAEIRRRLGFNYENSRVMLLKCIQFGLLPQETNIEIVLMVLHSFFCGVIKNWLMDPDKFDLHQHAPVLVDNILLSLRPRVTLPAVATVC